MTTYKKIFFSIIAVILFFGLAELVARQFIFPGSYDYIERRIIEHGLTQHKKPGEFRIFLYGESTMHGGPLYPRSVIGKWLRLYLTDLLPEGAMRNVTIVNFGRMGANSQFITNSFLETVRYKPDLAIFYTVHNDFCLLDTRLSLISKKSWMQRIEDFCGNLPKRSSFLNLFNRQMIRMKIERNKIRDIRLNTEDPWYAESDTPEYYKNEVNLLRPGSSQFKRITENFENNVNKIIETARRSNVPVIFFEGLSRWKGYEPIRSLHGATFTRDMLLSWEGYFSKAENLFARKEYGNALTLYLRCVNIDPTYALSYYRIAECYERLGEYDKVNKYYVLANDNDYFPIHAPSLVNRFYESIRTSDIKNIDIIQTQKLFEENSSNGIVDENLVIDQIHPTPEGQALMALEITKVMYKNNLITPRQNWRWDRLRSADELKKTLDPNKESVFHVYTATASYLAKHYFEAAKFLEKALTIKPDSVLVRSWLAWTYWKMGELGKAVILYRELYKEKPLLASEFFKKHPYIKEAVETSV